MMPPTPEPDSEPIFPTPSGVPLPRRSLVRTLGLVVGGGGILLPWCGADAAGWEVVKVNGRDYITAASIHKFYRFRSFNRTGDTVVFRSDTLEMRAKGGSSELFINRVKFILSFPALKHEKGILFSRMDLVKLVDPVLRPSYIRVASPFNTVVIDPGHGGHDPGGKSVFGKEKEYNLDTGRLLRRELLNRGFKVHMTRDRDFYLTLGKRVSIANGISNAIFISIHFNSSHSSAKGLETFALPPQGASSTYTGKRSSDNRNYQGNRRDSQNIALATAIHSAMLYRVEKMYRRKPVDRGVKRARYAVLRGINKPAVLVEGGFLTNREEARRIASSEYRRTLAQAVSQAVSNYRKALTKR